MLGRLRAWGRSQKDFDIVLVRDSNALKANLSDERVANIRLAQLEDDIKSKQQINPRRAESVVSDFISLTEKNLHLLEEAKRAAEKKAMGELQEISQVIQIERSQSSTSGSSSRHSVVSQRIKQAQEQLLSRISHHQKDHERTDHRVGRGRKPIGYLLKRAKSDPALAKQVRRDAKRTERSERGSEFSVQGMQQQLEWLHANRISYDTFERYVLRGLRHYGRDERLRNDMIVDLEIEEARQLHHIGHFKAFCVHFNLTKFIAPLTTLEQRASHFIFQDLHDDKQLGKYAARLEHLSREINTRVEQNDESPIAIEETTIDRDIGATLFSRSDIDPSNIVVGVVIAPAIGTKKENYKQLAEGLASRGWLIAAIDAPSHGKSKGEYRMGVMAEHISKTVKYLRNQRGMKRVALCGHSMGGLAGMLGCIGYDQHVENYLQESMTKLMEHLVSRSKFYETVGAEIESIRSSSAWQQRFSSSVGRANAVATSQQLELQLKEQAQKIEELNGLSRNDVTIMANHYENLKKLMTQALRYGRFDNGHIDAYVFYAPPNPFQMATPSRLWKFLSRRNKLFLKIVFDSVLNVSMALKYYHTRNAVAGLGPQLDSLDTNYGALRLPDAAATTGYVASMKNPCDYISLVDFFAKSEQSDLVKEREEIINRERLAKELGVQLNDERVTEAIHLFQEAEKDRQRRDRSITTPLRRMLNLIVYAPPKYFIVGKLDLFLRPWSKLKNRNIQEGYEKLGNANVEFIGSMGHSFQKKYWLDVSLVMQQCGNPEIVQKTVNFITSHIPEAHEIPPRKVTLSLAGGRHGNRPAESTMVDDGFARQHYRKVS